MGRCEFQQQKDLPCQSPQSDSRKVNRRNTDFTCDNNSILRSGRTWENPEQRDNEIDAEIGLKIVIGLTAANRRNICGVHLNRRRIRDVGFNAIRVTCHSPGEVDLIAHVARCEQWMSVRRDLADCKRNLLRSTRFCQDKAVALMDWNAATEVW